MKYYAGSEIRQIRRALGLNQHDFWSPLGITQSGGCRYELERGDTIPKPIQILLNIMLNPPAESTKVVNAIRTVITRKEAKAVKVPKGFGELP